MKHLKGNYYVEVKDKRHIIHLTENIKLRLLEEPKAQELNVKFKITLR